MFVMQRAPLSTIVWLPILFALYACTSTVPHTSGDAKPVIVAAEKIGKPVVVATESKTPESPLHGSMAIMPIEVETKALAPLAADDRERLPLMQGDEAHAPHIALLLPLKSAAFGAAAEVVQQGFMASANVEAQGLSGELPVRVYGSFDESNDIVVLYRQAIAGGAQVVVGPLTRIGVSVLAAEQDIPVPSLALNVAEGQFASRLYFFGMMVEEEARQVAQLAWQHGLRQAIVIAAQAQFARRLQF